MLNLFEHILFSTLTGVEIIAKIEDTMAITDTRSPAVEVTEPMVIRPYQVGENKIEVQLAHHSTMNPSGTHLFHKTAIASISTSVPEELIERYIKATTGIIVPSRSPIVTG